jgi:hypothetical protein
LSGLPKGVKNKMSNYYHVRISNIKKNPFNDYNIFLKNVELKSEAVWDKDRYNKIKIDDYIGFIVGDVKNAMVHIYKVKSEVDRENKLLAQRAAELKKNQEDTRKIKTESEKLAIEYSC